MSSCHRLGEVSLSDKHVPSVDKEFSSGLHIISIRDLVSVYGEGRVTCPYFCREVEGSIVSPCDHVNEDLTD